MDKEQLMQKLKEIEDATDRDSFNDYPNEAGDWRESVPKALIKSEDEMLGKFLLGQTRTKYKITKGYDPQSKQIRTGVGYSGFDEINTTELTTGAFINDISVGAKFVNYCNMLLAELEAFQTLHGIDVTPIHRSILERRDLFANLTKGIDFRLGKAFTINRAEMIRTENTSQMVGNLEQPKKKSWFGNFKLKPVKYQPSKITM